MNYIIDPMFFYWIGVLVNVKIMCIVCLIATAVVALFVSLAVDVEYPSYSSSEEEQKKRASWFIKIAKYTVISIVVFCSIFIITPSKETMYQMAAASLVTTDNIQLAKEEGKEITKFITEQFCTIIEEVKK